MLAVTSLATTSSLAAQNSNSQADTQNAPEEIEVSGARLSVAATGQSVVAVALKGQATLRLDSALGSVPGLGLFRRANSFTAHPTTQGLSMRGVGANAAGRVLVTLDGIPQNDPFGGWVYWSGYQGAAFSGARVRRGGSPGAFGAQALAGAVDVETEARNQVSGFYGSDYSFGINGSAVFYAPHGDFTLEGGYFETDGDYIIGTADRGPIDARAASDAYAVGGSYAHKFSSDTTLTARVRAYGESRVNGLSLAVNESDAIDTSLWLLHQPVDGTKYELTVYYRDRDFANTFASARDNRTTERAVLDQFDVPAWGAGFLARVQVGGLEFGLDGRRMSGETNERFRNLGAGFTRVRRAGGDQWILGGYGEYAAAGDWGELSATVRLDRWRTFNGERVETSLEDGSIVRDDVVPNRADWVASGRVGYERELTGAIRLRTAAFKSWRLPTLNEFYRPFRVVNDITEANPNLTPETLYGLEFGFDYQPLNTVSASVTYYRNWLHDAVGNVTIGFGPGFFPLGGFVPAGGVLRQRANVDRTTIDGVELAGRLELDGSLAIEGQYLYARSRVTKFDANPDIVGNRPVQTPRHSASMSITKRLTSGFWRVEARYAGHQFDDDLNTRRLGSIFTVNAGASFRMTDAINVTAEVENLFDAKVVSALSLTGLETIAQRRFVRVGFEASF